MWDSSKHLYFVSRGLDFISLIDFSRIVHRCVAAAAAAEQYSI